ncbi:MAG TPA: hypothetical protein PLV42_00195 [bacterium]|nr:hypothetical protein [bacterium]
MRRVLGILTLCVTVGWSAGVRASSFDESLRDDVFAMVSTTQILNTVFLLDTSEAMNTFAYSSYLVTCADSIQKITKAGVLCWQSYQDCMATAAGATTDCGVQDDLYEQCAEFRPQCENIDAQKVILQNHCTKVQTTYAEPAKSDTAAWTNAKALRFVGPWDPNRGDYSLDLCFWDWTADTGFNAPDGTYSEYANDPATPIGPDRRDWSCVRNDLGDETVSGLWLNWKFATALDAVKIILADEHEFGVQPRHRGNKYACYEMEWVPTDPDTGSECFAVFNTEDNETNAQVEQTVRTKWKVKTKTKQAALTDENACYQPATPGVKFEAQVAVPDPAACGNPECHDAAGCSKCWDMEGNEVVCQAQTHLARKAYFDPSALNLSVTNEMVCCKIFHCAAPKCRDDLTCVADPIGAPGDCPGGLGAYSEWDQDPLHCCDVLYCAEDDGGVGCGADGSYIPGPSDTYMLYTEANFEMEAIDTGIGEYYSLAELTTASTIDITLTAHVKNANLQLFAGCIGELSESQVFNKDYTVSTTENLAAPIPMLGCDQKGYRLRAQLTVTHTGLGVGAATADLVFTPELAYYKNGFFSRTVLQESTAFFRGRSWEPEGEVGDPVQVVNEYECKTTFFSMKTKIVTSEAQCNTPECDIDSDGDGAKDDCEKYPACLATNNCYTPYTIDGTTRDPLLCRFRNMQDLKSGKYNCGWICPDAPQYDDLWRCMEYFEQLDHSSALIPDSLSLFANGTEPYNASGKRRAGPGENLVHCDYQNGDTVNQCCSDTEAFYNTYLHFFNTSVTAFKDIKCTQPKCLDDTCEADPADCPTGAYSPWDQVAGHCCVALPATGWQNYRCAWTAFDSKEYTYDVDSWGNEKKKTILVAGVENEIVKGHIQEVPGGSYLLNGIKGDYFDGYSTPYVDLDPDSATINKWYSDKALVNYGKSTVASSFVSLFKTSENADRMTACAYDMAADMLDQVCGDCGSICGCGLDTSTVDYCDFPTFWVKVAQSDGGTLVMEPKNLIGQKLVDFKNIVKNLEGKGGATLGETLYEVWRYLGGLKPAYEDIARFPQGYASPIETDPACFQNSVIIISGGQPLFDSNSHMDATLAAMAVSDPVNYGQYAALASLPDPVAGPYLIENLADLPAPYGTSTKPYTIDSWFLTALPDVATFVNSQDAFIGNIACRANPLNYRFGFNANSSAAGATCRANDSTGLNLINRIDTVGIGTWGLAALYVKMGNNPDYLNTNTLSLAAKGGGGSFTLTTEDDANPNTFSNLTDLFNKFTETHSGMRSIGRPYWTSSPIQPQGATGIADQNLVVIPAAIPVSNKVSRFWFGNLRKYYMKEKGATDLDGDGDEDDVNCILGETPIPETVSCRVSPIPSEDFLDDCFDPSSEDTVEADEATSKTEFEKVFNGGIRTKLDAQLKACPGNPCFKGDTGRNLYFDYDQDGDPATKSVMRNFTQIDNTNTLVLKQLFDVTNENYSRQIINYVYGYDSVDHDNDGDDTEIRSYTSLEYTTGPNAGKKLLEDVGDPFDSIDPALNQGWKISIPYSILGAIVHNEPIVLYYGPQKVSGVDEPEYLAKNLRIFVGANDGLMHSFDGLGNEKWGYMPSVVMPKLSFILSDLDTVVFNSSVDGPSTVFHIDDGDGVARLVNNGVIDTNEKAFLIFGYRRGIDIGVTGHSYYTVIDISDRDAPAFVQHIEVEGQSWSKPVLFRKGNTYYMAIGGGYDPCYDNATPSCGSPKGAKIYIYEYGCSVKPCDSANEKFLDDATHRIVIERNDAHPQKKWLVAPIVAEGIAINTKMPLFYDNGASLLGDTEYLVFVDLTGTVFRVDPSTWTVEVLSKNRAVPGVPGTPDFTQGVRTYHSFTLYPPTGIYPSKQIDGNDDDDLADAVDVFIAPLPISSGNKVTIKEQDIQYEMVTTWSMAQNGAQAMDADHLAISTYPTGFVDSTTGVGTFPYTVTARGWFINYDFSKHEKGTTPPLVLATYQGLDRGWVSFTTYEPETVVNQCANKGNAFQYMRTADEGLIPEGYECAKYEFINSGLAAAPRVVYGGQHADDENILASAGANVYSIERLETAPPTQTIRILKWYELY